MGLRTGLTASEKDTPDPASPGGPRSVPSEKAAAALASQGVRVSVVRLPPSVHDQTKQGLVTMMIDLARKKRVSIYVGDGGNRWAAVHRIDAARLYRLALEKGEPRATYHAVAEEGIPVGDIANVIGRCLNVPIVAKSPKEPAGHFGMFAPFFLADNPVSSLRTRDLLGWQPTQPGLIFDIGHPTEFNT
jgi:nucleoside-diphosphate-sugar epimerase